MYKELTSEHTVMCVRTDVGTLLLIACTQSGSNVMRHYIHYVTFTLLRRYVALRFPRIDFVSPIQKFYQTDFILFRPDGFVVDLNHLGV